MRPLSYLRAAGIGEAVATVSAHPGSAFLAGGTTEVDLVRLGVARPELLVDINDLPLADVEELTGGGLRIGALARMSDVARAPVVVQRYPAISQALLLGASEQLRNMASMGGNLLPADALRVLPGRRLAVQQARARHRLLGARTGSTAATRSSAPASTASPPTPRTSRSRWSRFDAVVQTVGPSGDRAASRSTTSSCRRATRRRWSTRWSTAS